MILHFFIWVPFGKTDTILAVHYQKPIYNKDYSFLVLILKLDNCPVIGPIYILFQKRQRQKISILLFQIFDLKTTVFVSHFALSLNLENDEGTEKHYEIIF